MDTLLVLIMFVINQPEVCTALPAEVRHVGPTTYQVLSWTCGPRTWHAWQKWCTDGQGYFGWPFFLEETSSHMALYLNRFGEVHSGQGALLENAYVPHCGS